MKRLILWVGMVVGALAVVGAAMLLPKNLGQTTGRWVSPVERHNEAIEAVGIEDRAYPILAKFMALDTVVDRPVDNLDALPGEEGWDEVAAWIDDPRTQESIELLARASGCSILGMPMLDYEDSIWVDAMAEVGIELDEPTVDAEGPACLMWNVLLPMPGAIVQAGKLLNADAMVAIERDDQERFIRDVQTWAKLAMFADEPAVLVGQMVQAIEIGKITRLISGVLVEHSGFLDDVAAAEIEAVLNAVSDHGVFTVDVELEISTFEDSLRRIVDDRGDFYWVRSLAFTDSLDDDALIPPEPSSVNIESMSPELLVSFGQVRSRYEAAAESVALPWQPFRAGIQQEFDESGFDSRIVDIAEIVFSAISVQEKKLIRAMSMFRTKHQQMIGVRVAIAAHRHSLRHGVPAMGLSDIDDDLMNFDPVDGFTGGPVQYRWTEGRMLVYAVGADGDDDGGVEVVRPEGVDGFLITDEYLREGWNGDMVLFPNSD